MQLLTFCKHVSVHVMWWYDRGHSERPLTPAQKDLHEPLWTQHRGRTQETSPLRFSTKDLRSVRGLFLLKVNSIPQGSSEVFSPLVYSPAWLWLSSYHHCKRFYKSLDGNYDKETMHPSLKDRLYLSLLITSGVLQVADWGIPVSKREELASKVHLCRDGWLRYQSSIQTLFE